MRAVAPRLLPSKVVDRGCVQLNRAARHSKAEITEVETGRAFAQCASIAV